MAVVRLLAKNERVNRRRFLQSGSLTLTGALISGQDASKAVRVRIDPKRLLGRTPSDFLGFGYEISSVAVKGLLCPTNRVLVQLYRNLGSPGVVRIGGNTADFASWSPEGQAMSAPKGTVINKSALSDRGEFLHLTGWKLIWNLNLGSGSAESAADEAVTVAECAGDHLLCFQIGNEPDIFFRSGHRSADYDYAAYHREFSRFAAELHRRLPRAPIGGPDVAVASQWVGSFANDEHGKITLLTEHYYRAGQRQPSATFENLLNTDPRFLNMLQELRRVSQDFNIPYRLVELNSFSGGGKPGVSDTFSSALWALDLMFTLSFYGGAGLNLETGLNQLGFVSSYSPIFDDQQGHLTGRPSYYAMLAFAMAGRGWRIQTDLDSSGANFSAFAVLDDANQLWVTLINKEVSRSVEAVISSTSKIGTSEVMRLVSPSFDATSGVRFAETEVSANGTWEPKAYEKITPQQNQLHLEVPRASGALLRCAIQ